MRLATVRTAESTRAVRVEDDDAVEGIGECRNT